MDVLRLKQLEFYGRHGTEIWEKENGCRFTVDLALEGDFTEPARSDRLGDALDYRVIFARARRVVEQESHNLIEKVAARLLHEMFRTFNVRRVTVRVTKPDARIGGLHGGVEVELTRTREEWAAQFHDRPAAVETAPE